MSEFQFELELMNQYLAINTSYFLDRLKRLYVKPHDDDSDHKHYEHVVKLGFLNKTTMCKYNLCEIFDDIILVDVRNEIRYSKKIYINSTDLYMVYDISLEINLEVLLAIIRILFVASLLWAGAFLFMKDLNHYITIPLEKTFDKLRTHEMGIEDIYYNIKEYIKDLGVNKSNIYEAEIRNIELFYYNSSHYLVKALGLRSFKYFNNKIVEAIDNTKSYDNPIFKLKGVFVYLEINFDTICEMVNENITHLYSSLMEIIDLTCLEYFGEVLKFQGNEILLYWDIKKTGVNIENYEDSNSDDSHESENVITRNVFKKRNTTVAHNEIKNIIFSKVNAKSYKNAYVDLAMIAALKIYSRLKFGSKSNELFHSMTGYNLSDFIDIKITIDKGKIFNIMTCNDNKIDSFYMGRTINNIKALNVNIYLFRNLLKILD
jgi:hypothetical protein